MRKPRYLIRFIVASLIIWWCASHAMVYAQTLPFPEERRTKEFLFDPFDPPINRSLVDDNAIWKVRLRFGAPDRETRETVIDYTDPTVTAELLVWYYDGLVIHMQGWMGEESHWITKIELTGADHTLKYGLGLNVDKNEFETILEPSLINNKKRTLRFDSSYTQTGKVEGHEVRIGTVCVLFVDFDEDGKAKRLT